MGRSMANSISIRLKRIGREFNEQNFCYFAFLLSFILILTAVIRASTTGLAYDESYTYMQYANPDNFMGGVQLLNNHWLNTFLIYTFDMLSGSRYNDFMVRLPNIIFFVFYCYGAYLISCKLKFNYLIFSFFLLNHYLFEYFCNGRGYGIGAGCVLLACYFLILFKECQTGLRFNCFIFFSCLAVLANGICIYITAGLVAGSFLLLPSLVKIKKYILPIVIYCFLSLCVGCFIIYVSRQGYPIYAGGSTDFYLSIGYSLLPTRFFAIPFSCVVAIIFIYSIMTSIIKGSKPIFTYACLIFLLIAYLSNHILGRSYPIGREMLPFYPLVICAVGLGIQTLNWKKEISGGIIVFLIVIFILQFFTPKDSQRYNELRSEKDTVLPVILENFSNESDDVKKYIEKSKHASSIYYLNKYHYLKMKNSRE